MKTEADGYTEGGEVRDIDHRPPPGTGRQPRRGAASAHTRASKGATPNAHPPPRSVCCTSTSPVSGEATVRLYNLVPPPGVVTEFGFNADEFVSLQSASLLTEEGYGVRISAPERATIEVSSVTATIWGVPADPGHDPERYCTGSAGTPGCVTEAVPRVPHAARSCGPHRR